MSMKKKECTGCMACYNACTRNCIKMKKEFDGCYYPHINKTNCIDCGKCRSVCPILNRDETGMEEEPDVYVGYCNDNAIRQSSSSGGIFPLAAEWCLDKGGVVFGAEFRGVKVVHSSGENYHEIEKFKGSKYVQSDIGTTYREAEKLLNEGRYVLFTGLPCQIEGLKSYLGKEYERLYTVDLICHGVGAPGIWEKYIKVFHNNKAIEFINFKNKDVGWNHEQFVIRFSDGKEYSRFPLEDSYTYGFNNNVFLREACYECKFKGKDRNSDLTIGDAWGVERYAPRFRDDKGCSLIFVHSKKGQILFQDMATKIEFARTDQEKAIYYNPRMVSSSPKSAYRNQFYNNLKKYPFWLCMRIMMNSKE